METLSEFKKLKLLTQNIDLIIGRVVEKIQVRSLKDEDNKDESEDLSCDQTSQVDTIHISSRGQPNKHQVEIEVPLSVSSSSTPSVQTEETDLGSIDDSFISKTTESTNLMSNTLIESQKEPSYVYKQLDENPEYIKLLQKFITYSPHKRLKRFGKILSCVFGTNLKKYKVYRIALLKEERSDKIYEKNYAIFKDFALQIQGVLFMHASTERPLDRAYLFRDSELNSHHEAAYKKLKPFFLKKRYLKYKTREGKIEKCSSEYKVVNDSKKIQVFETVYDPIHLSDLRVIAKDLIIDL
ncbi:unnamed protein product [Moneuplotes crassus]|uniref:Uncharacterized protein n=1 Tax=Euplotes crassus TaxID=5936 RepID=A0AAD1XPZ6_EUPCR|nr:unnamed protein product [Moneuplotes crassus]